MIATGVTADGHREVLGFAVGDSESEAFWASFLRSLKARGLTGTQLVISDAHTGAVADIEAQHYCSRATKRLAAAGRQGQQHRG